MRIPVFVSAMFAASLACAAAPPRFGVCAHLGGHEFPKLVQELDLMKAAGVNWARADFSWSYFEPKDGQFRFDRYDQVVQAARERGVRILPILCYSSPWAGLAHEHLDAWTRFVRRVVERYGRTLRYWEVWNEPNIGFWKPKPDPRQYAALLKATYETIKSVDPELQVVYGGTAGIPLKFIRETLKLGAAAHFDVMAIHPYCYPSTIEEANRLELLAKLKGLLKEFGASPRIWITETGWPTHVDPGLDQYFPLWLGLVKEAARRQFPERKQWRFAVLVDPDFPRGARVAEGVYERLAAAGLGPCRKVRLDDLARVRPDNTDVLLGLFGEHFPKPHFQAMLAFVRDGGLLVHFGGVPLYYAHERKEGRWEKTAPTAGESYRRALHVGWEAWWTKKGLPKEARVTRPADGVAAVPIPKGLKTKRWFNDRALKPGDRFVPLLKAYERGKFIGYPSALYLLRSDLKGAVLVNCLPLPVQRGVDRATQAAMLSRAYLTYLAAGVEVFFWYEFRDGGLNRGYNEHNFGVIDYHLKPKPAYRSLKTLTSLLGPRPTFAGPASEARPGLMRVQATGANGRRFTVYWARRKPVWLSIDAASRDRIRTLFGEPLNPVREGASLRIKIGLAPVFVESRR